MFLIKFYSELVWKLFFIFCIFSFFCLISVCSGEDDSESNEKVTSCTFVADEADIDECYLHEGDVNCHFMDKAWGIGTATSDGDSTSASGTAEKTLYEKDTCKELGYTIPCEDFFIKPENTDDYPDCSEIYKTSGLYISI